MPVADSPSLVWISGTAMETMVWSMKVIATAKIIAARTRFFDRPWTGAASDMFSPLWTH